MAGRPTKRRAARKSTPVPPAPTPPARKGRPEFVPTDQDRALVQIMVAGGIAQEQICQCLSVKIAATTLGKHFKRELAAGAGEANARVIRSLHTMAIGQRARPRQFVNGVEYLAQSEISPNVNAAKWWTQARMGWTETVVVKAVDADADPATLSDADIAARLAALRRRAVAGGTPAAKAVPK